MKQSLSDLYELFGILHDNANIVTDALIILGNHQQSRERVYKKVEMLRSEDLHPFVKDLLAVNPKTLVDFANNRQPLKEDFNKYIVNIKEEWIEVFGRGDEPEIHHIDELYYADKKEITKELYLYVKQSRQLSLF